MRASICDIGFDGLEGGHTTTLRDTGCDEQPGRVTNGRDNFLRVEDVPDKFQRFRL
jgi:hypothetical protein